jgi:hypothetical protein
MLEGRIAGSNSGFRPESVKKGVSLVVKLTELL